MKLLQLFLSVLAAAWIIGCSSTHRHTKQANGLETNSTQKSLFITEQGYDDSIDSDGAQHTSIANFATDAQGIMAMDNLLNNLMNNVGKIIAIAQAGTNVLNTNYVANYLMRQQVEQPKASTSSRHLYKPPK